MEGIGEIRLKDYKIYYSGGDKHMFGVGFAIHKSWQDHVMQFQPISNRICILRLRNKFFNLSLINVHSPTENKGENDKDIFYHTLENIYDRDREHTI